MLQTIKAWLGLGESQPVPQSLLIKPADPARRSSQWPRVSRLWLDTHPTCAACGVKVWNGEKYIVEASVHHKKPFHLFPELELSPSNFITLCESASHNCHLWLGHLGTWKSWNDDVDHDAAYFLDKIKNRPMAA